VLPVALVQGHPAAICQCPFRVWPPPANRLYPYGRVVPPHAEL